LFRFRLRITILGNLLATRSRPQLRKRGRDSDQKAAGKGSHWNSTWVTNDGRRVYQAVIHWRGSNGPGQYTVTKDRLRDAIEWRNKTRGLLQDKKLLKRNGEPLEPDPPVVATVAKESTTGATVLELIEDWYRDKLARERSEYTIRDAGVFIGQIPESWLVAPASEWTRERSRCWIRYLSDSGKSWANHNLRFWRNVFNLALRAGKVDANPFSGIEEHKTQPRRRRLESALDERRQLLRTAVKYNRARNLRYGPVFLALVLLLEQALRRSDVCSLRWEYLDLANGTGKLPRSKTGPRPFPLSPRSRRLLAQWHAAHGFPRVGWVFADPGNLEEALWSDPSGLTHAFMRIRDAAGLTGMTTIPRLRLHDLKHESLSIWHDRGAPIHDLQLLSGNSLESLQIYDEADVKPAAGRLEALVTTPVAKVSPLKRYDEKSNPSLARTARQGKVRSRPAAQPEQKKG
jgi:integrase